jgi:hypothetical protein
MKKTLTILILILSLNINAQNCKCGNELKFVIDYYEENLPGFIDNVNSKNLNSYNNFKKDLLKQTKNYCDKETDCFKILLRYVEFFKDNHSSIYQSSENIDDSKKEEVEKFINSSIFQEREVIDLKKLPQNSFEKIENIFETDDGVYKVAVVKNKNINRDYVGVILESKTPLWKKGQVKFEIKKVGKNTFDMLLYMRNHSLKYYKNVKLKDGILNDNWFTDALNDKKSFNLISERELIFKEIDTETNYMYIPTFSGDWYAKILEFYKKNDSIIQSKPYLIIDVRNNGGGSDACVYPLLTYLYTKPFYGDNVDVYSTKENIRKSIEWYEQNKNDTINFDKKFFKEILDEIESMKSVPNKTFITRSKGEQVKLDTIVKKPSKIAIITNKHCASSCETLLFWAKESDKTIIVGENSGGYVGYGEISEVNTPNFNFILGCTMTRYNKQREFEVIGVSPKYYLTNDKDWIEQAIELLKKE